jgi:lipopolysaccharide export LptBFGC system permease protein LptF
MSRTLFWYIFKDLLRIFFMASGVLAGIMSFGGLLRPLTEHGLNMGQVIHMLTYFQFPMTAYSLPIAALFATTIVYGRLSADNEVVACRAAGISHLAMALPAFVLGLSVAILGLLMLCFVVPIFMLKAEKVIFSNVGQIITNEIERTHQLKLDQAGTDVTVFAQGAQVMPPNPDRPNDQVVVLTSPMFIEYASNPDKSPDAIRTPKDFYVAKQATCFIEQNPDTDELKLMTVLDGGITFPRTFHGMEGGVRQTTYAANMQSQVRENTKFMDVFRLHELQQDVSSSRRVRTVLDNFIVDEQRDTFLKMIASDLAGEDSRARLIGSETVENKKEPVEYVISRGKAAATMDDNKLIVGAATPEITRPVHVFQEKNGQVQRTFEAQAIEVSTIPDNEIGMMHVRIELDDVIERVGESMTPRTKIPREFDVPMIASIRSLPQTRTAKYYLKDNTKYAAQNKTLHREQVFISNGVSSELHFRASFAMSCLILVMVGCALGMMFRSGNFLSAFALSVIPALICIALIITGQHTCENVPKDLTNFHNPYELGRTLIWSGNVAVAVIAVGLLARLQRQ